MGRAFITLSTLILLIACALHPARAQQRLARTPVPVKIRARAGDTVQLLAERFNVLASDISRLNNLALDAALQPGEEVLIPSTTSPAFTPRRIVAGITNDARARATQHEPTIAAAAARYGVDPRLLWTIAFLETRFQPGQVSPKGARGMMQFMPDTAARYGLVNPNDPAAAIDAAARYVRDLARRFDNRFDLVLAGYNAGEGAVEAYLNGVSLRLPDGRVINPNRIRTGGVPPYAETRNYVARGIEVAQALTTANIFPASLVARTVISYPPSEANRVTDEAARSSTSETAQAPSLITPTSSYAFGRIENARAAQTGAGPARETDVRATQAVARSFRASATKGNGDLSEVVVSNSNSSAVSVSEPAAITSPRSRRIAASTPQR